MSKNQVNDLITDQEAAFAHLLLSGAMNDRQAAKAVGLNPDTAANTKSKPRVRDYMLKHRTAIHEQRVPQETDEPRRMNQSRDRVLARLWEIADLDPEMTRNSASAQIKAIAMIVAIEGLISPGTANDRRGFSSQNKSAATPVHSQIDTDARLGEQEEKATGSQPTPDLVPDEDGLGVPDAPHGMAAGSAEKTPSAPHALASASAPGTRVPSSTEKKPDTWRLRLS
jgi:hypothetical protein